jgi:hypothetical protein
MDVNRLPPELRPKDAREIQTEERKAVFDMRIVYGILTAVFYVVYGIGAYRLSYNTNGSVFLGVLAFIFAPLYYPYYGLFVSQPQQVASILGGRSRRR